MLVILDGLSARHVGPDTTPALAALAAEGRFAVGRAVMTSATYPNHATFATGTEPAGHGLLANWVVTADGPQPAHKVGPRVPTLFDVCPSAAAVFGDHRLVGVMGATAAGEHWPPGWKLPDGIRRDAHGYAADLEVVPRLRRAIETGADLVVGHFNEPDTAAHVHGPDADAALANYRRTDTCLAAVVQPLRPAWDETVLIVLSDHDLEPVADAPAIDLYDDAADRGLQTLPEGNGAVVWGDDPSGGAWLDGIDGVAGHAEAWPGARVVWAEPGRTFALPPGLELDHDLGQHGGATTRNQVAVVAGGHPAAASLAAAIADRPPDAADWAPTIAGLLGVQLPTATGRNLLE